MEKTNVMRILDQHKIVYRTHNYDGSISTDGEFVAKAINEVPEKVFKTLVTISNTNIHFVFLVPINASLDLKKAAKAVNVKSIEMIKQKDLLPLTGYVHGGCSPIGMKKIYTTVVDSSALNYDSIIFSAGKIGLQVDMNPADLNKVIKIIFSDIKQF